MYLKIIIILSYVVADNNKKKLFGSADYLKNYSVVQVIRIIF